MVSQMHAAWNTGMAVSWEFEGGAAAVLPWQLCSSVPAWCGPHACVIPSAFESQRKELCNRVIEFEDMFRR